MLFNIIKQTLGFTVRTYFPIRELKGFFKRLCRATTATIQKVRDLLRKKQAALLKKESKKKVANVGLLAFLSKLQVVVINSLVVVFDVLSDIITTSHYIVFGEYVALPA